ncbi:type II secretion system F family protein [Streptomyces sp. A3M-1-3]|uniref:type II secretion system F family protein n=1 Tax=Streptomyces sp. A3M-1-3 TaxID=2962044 RepID=UPI0020B7E3D8|nr:type II secretion system F family protein [Streptomyces sp. A3M-1-3]MCP3820279.1 type II secretion system F family protein [Streptomyces sp. A3M-1-3]
MGGRDQALRRATLMLSGGGPATSGPPWGRMLGAARARVRREWACLLVGALIAVVGESVLPLIGGALAVPLVARWLRARERAGEREWRGREVIALCGAVAGELRAGLQPGQALRAVVRGFTPGSGGLGGAEGAVVAAARFGGDVPEALLQAAREPGAEGLVGVAACWRVSVDGGAGLAAGLDRLEAALRAERDQREELRAQLAGARSTAVVLALLPVAGLLIGTALGAGPLGVLLHTPAGLGCLVVGGLLEGLGVFWAGRIVRAGERA